MSTIDRTIVPLLGALLVVGGTLPLPSVSRAGDLSRSFGQSSDAGFEGAGISHAERLFDAENGFEFGETITLTNGDATSALIPPAVSEWEPRGSSPFDNEYHDVPPVIESSNSGGGALRGNSSQPYTWHFLPSDTMFRSFIAGVHAPRMGGEIVHDSDQGALLDVTIGSRISLLRYGTFAPESAFGSEGVELQIYGAALTRLAMDRASDVEATDYKFGVPLVFRSGSTAHHIGYDHLSSHIGDEYLVRHPNFKRRNYVRDAVRYAIIQDITEDLAVYGEINRAFNTSGGAGGWHFQLGAEYEPYVPGGFRGAPVAAINTQLREEFDYEGSLGLVLGWQWRGMHADDLLRLGLSVYSGHSRQYSFYEEYEKLMGLGLWYDF